MSAVLDLDLRKTSEPSVHTVCTPFWYQVGEHWCSAFWHRARHTGDTARTAAVLCPSLMLEQVRGARHQRALGRMLAAAGIPALRMSYQGTDNSNGHALVDGNRASLMPAWQEAVMRAIEITRHRSQCERVVVVGRRIGGLIALNALRAHPAMRNVVLVLWDPALSGAHFLREIQLRNQLRFEHQPAVADAYADALESRVTVERSFVFSQATVDDLRKVTLEGLPPATAHTHVVVPRAYRQVSRAMSEWPANQHRVFTVPDASFDFDNWEGPQLPEHTLQAILDIAIDHPEFAGHHSHIPVLDSTLDVTEPLADHWPGCSAALHVPSLDVREEWVNIAGAPGSLAAVLTTPRGAVRMFANARGAVPQPKVLLVLGTGVDSTAGEGDANVGLARRVASQGIPVVRLDFRGIGESSAQSRDTENLSYLTGRTRDVADCVRFIKDRFPGATIVAMGLCSGAYWAIHAAASHVPIDEVIGVNPQLYAEVTTPGRGDPTVKMSDSVMVAAAAADSLADASKWRKLLQGRYSPKVVAMAVLGVLSIARELVTPRKKHFRNGMPRLNLEALFHERSRFHLVFSLNDVGYLHLMQHGPMRMNRLKRNRRLTLRTVRNADHTFSTPGMRRMLETLALSILEA